MPTASSSSSTRTGADRRAKVISEIERWHRPMKPDPQIVSKKGKHDAIVRIAARNGTGWVTSIPGSDVVRFDCLPRSDLPDELRELGLKVERDDPPTSERIVSGAIIETAMRGGDGELVPLTEGSSLPVVRIEHAGICAVERWRFGLG